MKTLASKKVEFLRKLEKDGIIREDKDHSKGGYQYVFRVVKHVLLPRSLLDEYLTYGIVRA